MTTLQAAVVVACFALVLTVDGLQRHRAKTNQKNARHLAALRGDDPYEADFDWRRNRAHG